MNDLFRLASLYWRIVLLQAKPQDVPASAVVMYVSIAAVVIINLIALIARFGVATGIALVVVDLVLLVGLLHITLRLANKSARFTQTLSALCGTGAWLSLLSLPLVFTADEIGGLEKASPSLAILLIVFHVWNITLIGHIVRHSFEVSFALGVAGAIAYTFGVIIIADMLIPTELTPAATS